MTLYNNSIMYLILLLLLSSIHVYMVSLNMYWHK